LNPQRRPSTGWRHHRYRTIGTRGFCHTVDAVIIADAIGEATPRGGDMIDVFEAAIIEQRVINAGGLNRAAQKRE